MCRSVDGSGSRRVPRVELAPHMHRPRATRPRAEIGNQHPVTPSETPDDPRAAEPDERRPLTVLIGADTFSPHVNGAARFAERLAAGLVARGHDVHVMAPSAKHWARGDGRRGHRGPADDDPPAALVALVAARLARVRAARGCRSTTRAACSMRCKPDVVHIQSHIIIGRGLAREARKRGIPIIATNHVMAENILDFTTLPHALERGLPQARVGRRQAHVRHDARSDHADAQGRGLPRGDDRHHRRHPDQLRHRRGRTTRPTSRRAMRTASCSSGA